MDPSIMKLLEEDEDETMHSGADVDAFTAALNRDIEGDNSTSQPSDSDSGNNFLAAISQGSSNTSNQFLTQWQQSSNNENATCHYPNTTLKQEPHLSVSDNPSQGHELSANNTHEQPKSEQDTPQVHESDTTQNQGIAENSQLQSMSNHPNQAVGPGYSNQQSMGPGLTCQQATQQAINALNRGKQVPFALLLPVIQPQLDKDRAMQLQTLYQKLKKNEISKEEFVRHMRSIVGDQMLKMAVYKLQTQARSSRTQMQAPSNETSNSAIDSNVIQQREMEIQGETHNLQANQISSSSSNLNTSNQERDRTGFPGQGLNKQQQQHLHFAQASFSTFGSGGNTYHNHNHNPFPTSNIPSSIRPQIHDSQMRQNTSQSMNMMNVNVNVNAPKFEPKRTITQGGGNITHMTNNTPVQWHSSMGGYVKQEPFDHSNDHHQRSTPQKGLSVNNANTGTLQDEPSVRQLFSSAPSTSVTSSHMDPNHSVNARIPLMASNIAPTNNTKTPPKKAPVSQKKPLEALGSPPPSSSKKQKVSGGLSDQSIEQLNDVTAVSGVNLKEEEEHLFSGTKDESRVSEASRRVVQEEEEKLILEKIPLQKKLAEIVAKSGLKGVSSDVEKCISLCVEERMRGLLSNLIRVSKQRADIEKSRHRTIITSDVRQQIMSINREAREEWEKKQADQRLTDPDGNSDGDKDREDGRGRSVNKEEDNKLRATAANVAARAAFGGDDMLSKWQLMAEQAKQKREGGPGLGTGPDTSSSSEIGKDVNRKSSSASGKSVMDNQSVEKRGTSGSNTGGMRKGGKNQGAVAQNRVERSITVKDVIAVLEREPQMSRTTLMYRLYEKVRSDAE